MVWLLSEFEYQLFMIQTLIDDYQNFINELQERLQAKQSYMQQHSSTAQTESDIQTQQSQIRLIIDQTRERQQSILVANDLLQKVHNDLIPLHPRAPTQEIRELVFPQINGNWDIFLKNNHELTVEIRIESIMPISHSLALNKEMPFDSVRFGIYQAGQSHVSDLFYYNGRYNLYRVKDLVGGRMLRGDRSVRLGLRHVVRPYMLELSRDLFRSHPLTLIAENASGLILGEAIIDIPEDLEEKCSFKRCVNLKQIFYESQQATGEANPTISARLQIKIEVNPIAPSLKDLTKNIRGKSKSPTRSVSKSPKAKGSPAKRKRELIGSIIKSKQGPIQLAVVEGVQARWKVQSNEGKREIVYRQLKNIKERKVQFCRIGQEYFLKCYLVRQKKNEEGIFLFDFAQKQYSVQVVADTLLTRISFDEYLKIKDKQLPQNRMICLGKSLSSMLHDNTRLLKNFLKLNLVDGIPNPIFIKSPFQDCLITTYPPFYIVQCIRKEGGYAVQFYYSLSKPIDYVEHSLATFSISSESKIPKQTHLYDCNISPRISDRQTLYRELIIPNNDVFCSLQMKGIGLDSIYNIRSTSPSLSVVNGSSYRLLQGPLILQIQANSILDEEIDLIARDEKKRCIVIRLRMISQDVQE